MSPTHPPPDGGPSGPRRGPRVVTAISIGLIALFTLSFAVGSALGLADPATMEGLVLDNAGNRPVAAFVVFALLLGDLFLPVPASVVMVAAGALFGTALGTAINTAGALSAALLGYALCRRLGAPAFARLVGDDELPTVQARFEQRAPWVVLLSRAVPMVTETVSCLAGLTRMPLPLFAGLSLLGTLPVAFVYALAGAELSGGEPGWSLAVAFGLPVLAWMGLRPLLPGRRRPQPRTS